MPEYTKISFNHRKEISDYGDLVEMLFPGNRNQQHAGVCILFELKWADGLVPNLSYLEKRYNITRRILQRSRAKLTRLGIIEHISSLCLFGKSEKSENFSKSFLRPALGDVGKFSAYQTLLTMCPAARVCL